MNLTTSSTHNRLYSCVFIVIELEHRRLGDSSCRLSPGKLPAKFAAQRRELCARGDSEPAHTLRPGIRSSYRLGRLFRVTAGS
jgi:hypothetical protein